MSVTVTPFQAQANNVAVSGVSAGDIMLVTAHRDGSTTPPTLAAGFTTLDGATGANTNSHRTAYKVCAGGETTSGTWTNATSVVVSIIHATAGETIAIGAHSPNGGASTSIGWLALTLTVTDGSSIVVLHGAHRSATNVGTNALSPSGLTNDGSATDCASFHSGTVSSWAAQTESVNANSGWRSEVVEITIAPAPKWSVVGSPTINDAKYGNPPQSYPLTVAMPSGVAVGDVVSVFVNYGTSGGADVTTMTATDNATAPNTYSLNGSRNYDSGHDQGCAMFRAVVTDASATTISISATGGGTPAFLAAMAVAHRHADGPITSDPLTGTPDNGNQASPGTGTDAITQPTGTTPAVNGALVVGMVMYPGSAPATTTKGSGFTLGTDDTTTAQQAWEWLEQKTAANIKATWTEAGGTDPAMSIVAAYAPPSGAAAYTLTAGAGAYAITGAPATPAVGRKLTAAPGAYSVTGDPATTIYGRHLAAAPGAYAISGTPLTGKLAARLIAAAGGYVVTGSPATPAVHRMLRLDAGAYAVLGAPATLVYTPGGGGAVAYVMTAAPGSYAVSGATLIGGVNRKLVAASGAYALTGQAVLVPIGRRLVAGAGSYVLTGKPLLGKAAWRASLDAGAYAITGIAARLIGPGAPKPLIFLATPLAAALNLGAPLTSLVGVQAPLSAVLDLETYLTAVATIQAPLSDAVALKAPIIPA